MTQNTFVVGDSHSIFYYNSLQFKHHWTGWAGLPVTLYELIQQKTIPLYNIVERYQPGDVCRINIKDGDIVMFCYGWNDVQKNIHKYGQNNHEQLIDSLVEQYVDIIKNLPYKIKPIINCIYPISQCRENLSNIFGDYESRIKYTVYMNKRLHELCQANNIPFFDIYDKLSDNGMLRKTFADNNGEGDHLDRFKPDLRESIETVLSDFIHKYYP